MIVAVLTYKYDKEVSKFLHEAYIYMDTSPQFFFYTYLWISLHFHNFPKFLLRGTCRWNKSEGEKR